MSKMALMLVIPAVCTSFALCGCSISGQGSIAPLGERLEAFKDTSFDEEIVKALAWNKRWKAYGGNPVLRTGETGAWDAGALGSMTVLKVDDVLHMYYEAWGEANEYASRQIGHAVSFDGVHWLKDSANPVVPRDAESELDFLSWRKDSANPVVPRGAEGERDGTGTWDPYVIHTGTWDPYVIHEDGIFKMWYTGGFLASTCYATSKDGRHFVKKGRTSNIGRVEDCHVVHDKDAGKYYMYYWDRRHEPQALFRAESPNETDFDFDNAKLIKIAGDEEKEVFKFTHVIREGDEWYMFYGDFLRPHCPESWVRLATSSDGLHWTSRNKRLIQGHDGEVLKLADDLYLMYYGPRNHFDAKDCDIRLALYGGELKSLVPRQAAILWQRPVDNSVEGTPAVDNQGNVYVSGGSAVYSYAPDGANRWTTRVGEQAGEFNSPSLSPDQSRVYGGGANFVYAIDAETGDTIWKNTDFDVGFHSVPAVSPDGSRLYFGVGAERDEGDSFYCIDTSNGSVKWEYSMRHPPRGFHGYLGGAITGPDGTIYVASQHGWLLSLTDNGDSYTENWAYDVGAEMRMPPSMDAEGYLYVGSSAAGGYVHKVDSRTGKSAGGNWPVKTTAGEVFAHISLGSDGTVYVNSEDRRLWAFNPDGTVKWNNLQFEMWGSDPLIRADGKIIVGSQLDGAARVACIRDDGDAGVIEWASEPLANTLHLNETNVNISPNGTIYIISGESEPFTLFAVKGNGTGLSETSPWAKYMGNIQNNGAAQAKSSDRNSGAAAGPEPFGAYYTRLPFPDKHTDKYADIVVRLDELGGQVVFGRESSYLPLWKNENGSWYFNEVVPRKGDGQGIRPDELNKYSYARVIESNPSRVIVHWRYMAHSDNVDPDGVVHEYFTITPSGEVTRAIREGTERFDDWNDPQNVATQTLQLRPNGIDEQSFIPANPQRLAGEPVKGNRVKESVVGAPAAWLKFDEGLVKRPYDHEFETKESVSGHICAISGNKAFWKAGVSGTALAFDGYHSKVTLPVSQAPAVSTGLTLDAWIALGAYPFNDTAIIQQSNHKDAGYFLGVTTHGNPTFKLAIDSKLHELTPAGKLPHNRWTHVVGTYDKASATMRVYVDGAEKGALSVPGSGITMTGSDVMVGVNNAKMKATDLVRRDNNIPQMFGIEGLIDEVKIYDTALSSSEVSASYDKFMPAQNVVDNPDLQARILPGETGPASRFGAYYTSLSYHDLWDTMWRGSEYQDLVVKFDQMPTSVIFWRGACFGPGWVTENNKWMSDQSAEVGGPYGCAEHMADKQARHTHVRLMESTPARVVIHWRHSCADIGYIFEDDRNWSDEYHTIYPDGVILRHVNFHAGRPGWHEPQLFSQAGTGPLDNISMQAVSAANVAGDVVHLDWSDGPPENPMDDSCIELYNLKSEYKVFGIFPDGTQFVTTGWFNTEQSPHTPDPFAGPWNHWPVSQLLSDGRLVTAYDRMTSCALGEGEGVTEKNIGMYGFTAEPVTSLIPLARSWNYPAEVSDVSGSSAPVYNSAQRAYELAARAPKVSCTLNGSARTPIVNPAFVISNWGSTDAQVKVDGQPVTAGVRQGHVMTADRDTLIVFIEKNATKKTRFEFSRD